MEPLQNKYAKPNEEKSLEKIVSGEVKVKKRSKGKKILDLFINEDGADIKEYLIFEVLVPAVKDTILDLMNMIFYGRARGRKNNGNTYVSYNSYSSGSGRRPSGRPIRSGYSFDDIVVDSRGEAEKVLDVLNEMIDRYGEATVADFYDLVGVTGNGYTDRSYGWKDLRQASVQRTREGYLFIMPRCQELN